MLRKKYFKIGPYGLLALALILLASTLRILVLAQGWPWMNSDEGTMGLMARHIAYQGELPIFFYGQGYMGALEAYIGSILFHIFGPSFFSLRFGLMLLYAAFLLTLYLLTGMLYTKKLALVTLLLLCFGSIEMFTRQLRAVGGDEETMLFSALIMLFTSLLILSFDRSVVTERKRRYTLYSCLGLSMGLGLWSHMLVIPFIAIAALFLFIYCRGELLGRPILFLLGGFIVGLLPLLIFNVKYPAQNSLVTFWQLHSSGGLGAAAPSYTVWDEIRGTLFVSLPMTTGANPLCSLTDVPGQWRTQISSCMLFQGSWGIGYILLLGIAIFLAARALRRAYRAVNMGNSAQTTFSADNEYEKRRHALRLMVLGGATLTLLSYMFSAAPALVPITSTRYLVGLLVAMP
ncbi:MAG: glycosyltransferase family 39 protein, partial [Ktedonobacteraceae bacterium]